MTKTGRSDFYLDEETHIYYKDGEAVPGVNEIIGAFRRVKVKVKGEEGQFHVNVFNGTPIPSHIMNWCAQEGGKIHDMCAKINRGQDIGPVSEKLGAAAGEYTKFLNELCVTPILVEWSGYSSKHHYAGTMDLFCEMSGPFCEIFFGVPSILCVCDIKSGKLSWTAGPQMAAYKNLLWESEHCPQVDRNEIARAVLLLPRDGSAYCLVPMTDPLDWPFFLIRRWEHRYLKNIQKKSKKKKRGKK